MHTCSRPLSDLLTAGWEMERAKLAEMWLPVRATAKKTSTWEREKGTFTSGATMTEPGKIPVALPPPGLWLPVCPVPTQTPTYVLDAMSRSLQFKAAHRQHADYRAGQATLTKAISIQPPNVCTLLSFMMRRCQAQVDTHNGTQLP